MTFEADPITAHLAREQMRKLFEEFEVAARKIARALPLDDQLSLSIPLEHFRRLLWPEYVRGGSYGSPCPWVAESGGNGEEAVKGLTPEEFEALGRLLAPPKMRGIVRYGSALEATSDDLVEQGRATYTPYPPEHTMAGFYDLTPAGREALRLWPLIRDRFVAGSK